MKNWESRATRVLRANPLSPTPPSPPTKTLGETPPEATVLPPVVLTIVVARKQDDYDEDYDYDSTTEFEARSSEGGNSGGSAPADHVIDLTFGTVGSGTWQINNIDYTPPSLPTLLTIINGGTYDSNFTKTEHTCAGITHPFHLQGHAFDVVQCASGPVNYKNPPRRDVVGVSDGGVIIWFRAGPWFLHCHIDLHLEAGLAVVLAEAPNDFRGDGPKSGIVTQQYLDLCSAYNALPADMQ
ncbi:Cupredoxin [Mycena epipterygia]|nr:Cupredoxin [Mycena epipterygia]